LGVVLTPGSVHFTSHLGYSPEHLAGTSVAWATDKRNCLCKRPLFPYLALKAARQLTAIISHLRESFFRL
jgi:hypothetical protein